MLGSAGISFILYTLTFLRLRGNIYVEGGKVRFCRIDSDSAWMYQAGRDSTDVQMTSVARGMIGYVFSSSFSDPFVGLSLILQLPSAHD
jgi:hypothetical protein